MPGIRLINAASFDADTTRAMGLAYEEACASLAALMLRPARQSLYLQFLCFGSERVEMIGSQEQP
jgi:hypothetical protein